MTLAAIILRLAPHLAASVAGQYAEAVQVVARKHAVDPLLVVALVQRESTWRATAASGGNYGLLQIRTSAAGRTATALLRPAVNLAVGLRLLAFWRRYHYARCADHRHHWWSHWQWGEHVHNAKSGDRVAATYRRVSRWKRGDDEAVDP